MKGATSAHCWKLIGISLLAIGVNLPVAWSYLGNLATLAYAGGCGVVAWLALRGWPRTDFWRWAALIGVVVGLGVQLFLLYYVAPEYRGHMDRDDALVLWWQRLGQGVYPYALPTGRGNPISVLPFQQLIALPFIMLGNVGYVTIAAVIGIAILAWRRYTGYQQVQSLTLLLLMTAPLVSFEVAGRSDIIVNLLLFSFLVVGIEEYLRTKRGRLPGLGLLIGAVAATRFAIWPAMVVPVSSLLRDLGLRRSAFVMTGALLGFAALVGPFVIWQPATFFGYAPLGVNATKLGTEPVGQALWIAVTGVVVSVASVHACKTGNLFLATIPVFACVTLATWLTFGIDVSYAQLVFVPSLFSFPQRAS